MQRVTKTLEKEARKPRDDEPGSGPASPGATQPAEPEDGEVLPDATEADGLTQAERAQLEALQLDGPQARLVNLHVEST